MGEDITILEGLIREKGKYKKIYRGEKEIIKIYKGNKLIWEKNES